MTAGVQVVDVTNPAAPVSWAGLIPVVSLVKWLGKATEQ